MHYSASESVFVDRIYATLGFTFFEINDTINIKTQHQKKTISIAEIGTNNVFSG